MEQAFTTNRAFTSAVVLWLEMSPMHDITLPPWRLLSPLGAQIVRDYHISLCQWSIQHMLALAPASCPSHFASRFVSEWRRDGLGRGWSTPAAMSVRAGCHQAHRSWEMDAPPDTCRLPASSPRRRAWWRGSTIALAWRHADVTSCTRPKNYYHRPRHEAHVLNNGIDLCATINTTYTLLPKPGRLKQ